MVGSDMTWKLFIDIGNLDASAFPDWFLAPYSEGRQARTRDFDKDHNYHGIANLKFKYAWLAGWNDLDTELQKQRSH